MAWSIQSRRAEGDPSAIRVVHDQDLLRPYLEDAAHFPGGHAPTLLAPETEGAVAHALSTTRDLLPIGAQSSLTGGATPFGDVLLSTARLNRIESIASDEVRLQAGVTLAALDEEIEKTGRYYPPAPTFAGAFIGGTVATNAAGAATFKYGTTRDWVRALTVVLPTGDVLDIDRGATRAHPDGYFDLQLAGGSVRVPVPQYRMPLLPKLSAGYFAARDMDLIDLFIGAEGTLGVVTAVTLGVIPRPTFCLAFVPFSDRAVALGCVDRLRQVGHDPRGIDVSAIEHLDRRSLDLVREDGVDRTSGVRIPSDTVIALLVTLELPAGMSGAQAFDEIGRALEPGVPDTPLVRFCRLLGAYEALGSVEIAVPGDRRRMAALLSVREAVPLAVNQRVGRAKQTVDRRIGKIAADVIVPFERIETLLASCGDEFGARGLDGAVWGHISDGHLHPNVIPRSMADAESGAAAVLALGREAIRLGGSPLAEHGVGRNLVKQQLLAELYGSTGIEEMRRVKRAIDPDWTLAPGVLFPRSAR